MGVSWQVARLDLGSNTFLVTDTVLIAQGKPMVQVEHVDPEQLLVTVDVLDEQGTTFARLRRNAWAFANPRFEVTTNPSSAPVNRSPSGQRARVSR